MRTVGYNGLTSDKRPSAAGTHSIIPKKKNKLHQDKKVQNSGKTQPIKRRLSYYRYLRFATVMLRKNSIGTVMLRKNSIGTVMLRTNTIATVMLRTNSIVRNINVVILRIFATGYAQISHESNSIHSYIIIYYFQL